MGSDGGAAPRSTERERWRAVLAVAGWQTAASLCYYSVFAATGFVRTEFGVSRTLVGVFVTATILGYTLNLFPSGAAVDGFGEKRVMLVGLAALAVAAVGVSLAPTFALLLVAGAVLGAAYSPAMPATNRGIVTHAPRGRANFAMGLKQVGVTAGSAAASLVITGVGAIVAWQTGFWVIAALAAAYGVVFAVTYDAGGAAAGGAAGSGTVDGTAASGRSPGGGSGTWSWPDLSGLAANRAYLLLVAAGFFVGASIFTMLGYVVPYVDEVIATAGPGSGAASAPGTVTVGGYVLGGVLLGGLVLGGTQVAGSAARIGAGLLADRLGGSRGAATVALAQAAASVASFGVLATGVDSPLVAGVVFAGLGLSVLGSTGVFYSCLSAIVPPEQVGSASAGGQTAINAGGLVAPPVFGYLADTAGYAAGWGLLAGLVAVATALLVGVRWLTEP